MNLTVTITSGQSGPGSNHNEGVTTHSPELQNRRLTTRYS